MLRGMGDASLTTELGRVLVTGGSGFVGANLVTTLLDHGYQVRSFDRAPSPLPPDPQLEVLQGDITRLIAAETDRVGHLAARLATLGPAATLARGYAVVQAVPAGGAPSEPMQVLRSVQDAPAGTRLRVRVSDGAVTAVSEGLADGH